MHFVAAFSFLFISLAINAEIKQFDVYGRNVHQYKLTKVCEFFGLKENPLIDIVGMTELDCMGTVVQIEKFCHKIHGLDREYSRAYLDKKNQRVICETASRINLEYVCPEGSTYCAASLSGCDQMKKKLAKNLHLTHHAILNKSDSQNLICYFSAKEESNYNEMAVKLLKSLY